MQLAPGLRAVARENLLLDSVPASHAVRRTKAGTARDLQTRPAESR